MAQIQVELQQPAPLAPLAAPTSSKQRRFKMPLWLSLLLKNPKSLLGLAIIGTMVALAIIAPFIASASSATEFNIFAGKQAPSFHHLFGTTDQGSDVWAGVTFGARRSLATGFLAATLATVLAATLGITAALMGGLVDEFVSLITNVVFVIPTIPLLIVVTSFMHQRGMWTMVFVLGFTLWAFEARILRGQALTLRNRDFIAAARASPASRRARSSSAS